MEARCGQRRDICTVGNFCFEMVIKMFQIFDKTSQSYFINPILLGRFVSENSTFDLALCLVFVRVVN